MTTTNYRSQSPREIRATKFFVFASPIFEWKICSSYFTDGVRGLTFIQWAKRFGSSNKNLKSFINSFRISLLSDVFYLENEIAMETIEMKILSLRKWNLIQWQHKFSEMKTAKQMKKKIIKTKEIIYLPNNSANKYLRQFWSSESDVESCFCFSFDSFVIFVFFSCSLYIDCRVGNELYFIK